MIITKTRKHSVGGFTLIELMIVIVIVAVLMGIALPAYQNQILRGHRAAAKAEILEIANRQEQYLLANRSYTDDESLISYTLPADVVPRYSFDISTVSTSGPPYFKIEFTPIGGQLKDGSEKLSLDSAGVKEPEDKWKR
jgi:type IV pilus assembly protein PilE